MDTETRYGLADIARIAGVTPRTVRYYIAQGLISGANEAGPAAWYDEHHLGRLRVIRELQRQHLPLAEIRARLSKLDDRDIAGLLEAPDASREARDGSALDYVRSVLAAGRPPSDPATPGGAWLISALRASSLEPSASDEGAAMAFAPAPPPSAPTTERSQWDRIALSPDIELHVRRPLSRLDNRLVDRLIAIGRQVLKEEKP